ncbi:unnamed protein product, partial [Schistosoma margrebowiei]
MMVGGSQQGSGVGECYFFLNDSIIELKKNKMSMIQHFHKRSDLIRIILSIIMIWFMIMLMDLSNGHLLIKEEKILRKLVNLIHATTTNDFNLCTIHSRQLQYLLYTTYNTTNTTTTTIHDNDIPSAAA